MHYLSFVVVLSCCLAGSAMAAGKAASRKAMLRPMPAPQAGCMGHARLRSLTAYVPGESVQAHCGQLLSTDTLLSVRRWDRT